MSFRVVVDTNVILSASRSRSPSSPAREMLERWIAGEFDLLYSEDLIAEYARKLQELDIAEERIDALLESLASLGEAVLISHFHEQFYPTDPDDVCFLLCAANGNASHLVTYDSDFDAVRGHYQFSVCAPIEFLQELRQSLSSSSP